MRSYGNGSVTGTPGSGIDVEDLNTVNGPFLLVDESFEIQILEDIYNVRD